MKKSCVIGAGCSGLPAIKSCLEEGLDVVCYEQSQFIGGLWRYRSEIEADSISVFRSIVQNNSKEVIAYSDYPPPKEFPVFLRHETYFEYLNSYCDHYNLRKHIRFQHKVCLVEKTEDFAKTGRWNVTVVNEEGRESTETFDCILICSGHHIYPLLPDFPGADKFQGKIVHSKDYKVPETFNGSKVVVVGFGNSAIDISTDLGYCTKETYLSTQNKGWVFPRYFEETKIYDHEIYRGWILFLCRFVPLNFILSMYENMANKKYDQEMLGIKPKHRIMSQRPLVSDALPLLILNGTIKIKPKIKELRPNGVVFESEDSVTEADVIICATGFKPVFQFLKGMEDFYEYIDDVYRLVFPTHLEHHSLAFIGLMDPNTAIPIIAEMQSRWVARVFSGKLELPPVLEMKRMANEAQETLKKTHYKGFAQKTFVQGPAYLNEIAEDLGVRPNLLNLLFTDPVLFCGVFFGPLCSYLYRIDGPNSWKGARQAVLGLKERAYYGVRPRKPPGGGNEFSGKTNVFLSLIALLGVVLFYTFV